MKWRNFGLVGLLTIGAVGCSGDKPAPNTTPIRTETVPPAPPSTAAAVVETTATTVAVGVETNAPVSTPPQRITDDYRIPMINNATPKTDLEREALEAAVELLVRSRRFQLLETKDMQVLAEVLTGEALERFIPEGTSAQPVVGVPSKDDRIVIEVVTQKSPSTVDLRLCLLDGATVYRESADGQLLLENDEFGTAIIAIELTNTPSGWRISKDENTSVAVGVDTCAK